MESLELYLDLELYLKQLSNIEFEQNNNLSSDYRLNKCIQGKANVVYSFID